MVTACPVVLPFVSISLVLALAGCPSQPSATAPSPTPPPPTPEPSPPTDETPPPSADDGAPAPDTPEDPAAAAAPSDPIGTALQQVPASISERYLLSISDDRSELTIDPRPLPTRRAAVRGGFSVRDSEAGGKIISLYGGPFRNGGWVRASFRERAPAERLAELRGAGYDVDQVRDLLVVDGERDPHPTLFAFSADAAKPGIVGVCSEVTIIDFGPGAAPAPIAVRKPVIYLYPERTTTVEVGLQLEGELSAVYPAMHDGRWTVTASPSGELVDRRTGRSHRYLFWEGTRTGWPLDLERAHCIPGREAASFLERVCESHALTDHECGDMVTYWLPELARNPYNLIALVDEETYGRYATLRVEPAPDTVIRSFMIFRRSEVPVEVGAPPLPRHDRRGFTVVEWGGASLDEAEPRSVVVH